MAFPAAQRLAQARKPSDTKNFWRASCSTRFSWLIVHNALAPDLLFSGLGNILITGGFLQIPPCYMQKCLNNARLHFPEKLFKVFTSNYLEGSIEHSRSKNINCLSISLLYSMPTSLPLLDDSFRLSGVILALEMLSFVSRLMSLTFRGPYCKLDGPQAMLSIHGLKRKKYCTDLPELGEPFMRKVRNHFSHFSDVCIFIHKLKI